MKVIVGKVVDLALGSITRVTEGVPEPIAVFHLPSGFYAISDTCTHAESSLAEGEIDDDEIECGLHGARFDIKTGEVRTFPATQPVTSYPTAIEDDAVTIEV